MGKSFISVNSKYYKHSNASGEMAHVDRLFQDNVNAFAEHTKNNFGSDQKLFDKYNELHQQRVNATGKKVRKDATTFVDSVVSFSRDQWEELEAKYPPEKLQAGMKKMMDDYLSEMKKTYGLEPVGYKFHLDEGHNKNDLKRNVHAHVIFYNYDFEKGVSPWRSLKKKDFSNFQDIAAKAFEKAGFQRGISKEKTNKQHLQRDEYIKQKQLGEKQKNDVDLKELERQKTLKEIELLRVQDNLQQAEERLEQQENLLKRINASISGFFAKFIDGLGVIADNVRNGRFDALDKSIGDVQQVIDDVYQVTGDDPVGDGFVDVGNDMTEKNGLDRPFKKKNRPT